ncbi:MAG: PaaI family thioesterase [Dehalococcoidia bacterium]
MNLLPSSGANLLTTLGIRLIEASTERAVAELDFRPELQQLTGLFHAGAILALADTAATYASMRVIDPDGNVPAERFPLAVQVSANLLRNVREGTITAEARPLHRGRTMIVVETAVRDGDGRSLAVVTSTHLVANR